MPRDGCKTFKALGIFLWYPNEEWLSGIADLCDVIEREKLLGGAEAQAIRAFAEGLKAENVFDAQEAYVDTFDRVRSLSLHLFEHVHGESRDRGQAMIDLAERYLEHGLTLSRSELPDYLPVFLEYLSLLPKEAALEELAETGHILCAIGKRLAERGNPYAAVFDCLTRLAGREPEKVERKMDMAVLSFAELDKEWEDKPIDFMGAEEPKCSNPANCASSCAGSRQTISGSRAAPMALTGLKQEARP
jgi:nitrate reductase molybdenum cofactor assembly chaperone NarJ/NarW